MIFAIWLALAIAVAILASNRGRSSAAWFLLSLVISPPIAGVFLLVSKNLAEAREAGPTPETHVRCPDCAELVRNEAKVCRHCGCKLVPQPPPPTNYWLGPRGDQALTILVRVAVFCLVAYVAMMIAGRV